MGLSPQKVKELVNATLEWGNIRDALISVAFVGVAGIARLNREFLSHEGPTDVISFAMRRDAGSAALIGDIYICPRIAERNGRTLRISAKEELARLVVHGTLHVLGFEHPEGDARTSSRMWKAQERILESLR